MNTESELIEALEALTDAATLYAVVDALSTVAARKADHLRDTWQDWKSADEYDAAAWKLAQAAVRMGNL